MTGADLSLNDRAGDRRKDGGFRIDAALLLKARYGLLGQAEDSQFVARRLQCGLRRAQVVLRLDQGRLGLLIILERNGLALEQILGAGFLQSREVERGSGLVRCGRGRNEIVLRLHGVGGLDHEQRLALRDAVARPGKQFGDPARVRRKHRRRAILVDRDLAFGHVLGPEGSLGNRLNGQAGPFGRARSVALQSLAGLAGDFGMLLRCPADMHKPIESSAGKRQQGRANGQLFPTKHL